MNPARTLLDRQREQRQRNEHGDRRYYRGRTAPTVIYVVPQPPFYPEPVPPPMQHTAVTPQAIVAPPPVEPESPPAPEPPADPEPPVEPAVVTPLPRGSTTMYVIPGCYLGNVEPRQSELRAGCDLANMKKMVQ